MIKVLFILPSMKAGGAEKVISFISQRLDPTIFEVTLLVHGFRKDQAFEVQNIRLLFLNKSRFITSVFSIVSFIRKDNPDIVISSIGHINIFLGLLSFIFPKIKFAVREASVGSIMETYSQRRQVPFFIRKALYQRLDMVICQSRDMLQDFQVRFNFPESKSIVINNPVTFSFSKKVISNIVDNSPIKFITVGSLSKVKGYERILENLAKLNFDFRYQIIGNGQLKSDIKNLITRLGLNEKVTMLDHTNNVQSYLLSSNMFIQGSYVEGFPNALLEALSVGLPCLVYDAPGGTREIIRNGFNGFIVSDESQFNTLLAESIHIRWCHQDIANDIEDRFGANEIIKKYEKLFLDLIAKTK